MMTSSSDAAAGELVQLYIYDLSGGMARTFSQMLLGRQIEAIWHTAVVVGGMEHFFGGGINVVPAGGTPFGRPQQVLDLGYTQLPEEVRSELLADLSERYTPEAYSLFHNNCNTFSNELAELLCGRGVPAHITGLPAEVLGTPFGQMVAPMLSGLERQLRGMQQQQPALGGVPLAALGAPSTSGSGAVEAATEAPHAAELEQPVAGGAGAVAAAAAGGQQEQQQEGAGGERPALLAAEVELEAAVAAGMMQDAAEQQQQQQAPGASHNTGAPFGNSGEGQVAAQERLATELEVEAKYRRLMACGGVPEHEVRALPLEAVAAKRQAEAQAGCEAGRSGLLASDSKARASPSSFLSTPGPPF